MRELIRGGAAVLALAHDLDAQSLIEEIDGVRLMPPIYSSTYADRDVVLHPLRYDDPPGGDPAPD